MNKIKAVFSFGGPYLARYWQRLVIGILLGIIFGLVNASFVWATKTTFDRLNPNPDSSITKVGAKPPSMMTQKFKEIAHKVGTVMDPWLPKHGRGLDARQVIGGLFLLPFLIALRGTVGYLSTYSLSWVSERAINDLRVDILAKLTSLSLDFFHRSKTGDLLQRVNADTVALQQALSLGFSDLIKEPVTIIFLVASLLFLSVKLTLFTIIFLPLCLIPIIVLGKKVRRASGDQRASYIVQLNLLVEAISGIRVIKAFGLEGQQVDRFRATCQRLVRHGMKGVQARGLVNPIIEFIALTGVGALLVYVVYADSSFNDLAAFLLATVLLFEPIKKLANVHVMLEQTSVGVERLISLLNEKSSIEESQSPKPLPQFKQGIAFENVTFAYGEKPALNDISVTVPRGCKLGIAGESGSGKSTMVNLLMRFYDPVKGAIKIDDINLRDVTFNDLRQHMALVSQEIVVFDQSVADNIACGKKGATREEIEEAAKAASAHDFIRRLPQGYDTIVGERGQSLSGGQRQRLAIARAFIRNAPILVLDEATASLDSHAETEVQAAIEKLEQNKTVICVAHRLSTLMDMDQIIVLTKDGRIVERGTFEELLRTGGVFADMARKQGLYAQMKNVA
jgi:ABC-type multidrug transport system fused ATPase/permease subunit